MKYIDEIDKKEEMTSNAEEPVLNMDLQRTLNFFERHHDPNASLENAMPLNEAFDILRERIKQRYNEKKSLRLQSRILSPVTIALVIFLRHYST